MKVRKLHENNELSARAAKHKKRSKGLSPFCSLNTDAGNVEHNVAMFNNMNTPVGDPSVNPCGPMSESVDKPLQEQANDTVELHYDDLEVEVCVKPRAASGYGFDYDRDEARYEKECVSHDYSAPLSEVVNIIAENLEDEEFGGSVYDATDEEVNKFILDNFDRLFDKYERTILAAFEDDAKEDALRYMNESCRSNLKESSGEYIIMAINHDGSKKYYNVSSAPHWVDNGKDATIFDDMDEARSVWFDLNKKPFKRVFIPNYDPQIMNEALTPVDFDKMYAIDMLRDKTSWMMDEVVGKEYQVIPYWSDGYKVNTKTGRPILQVQFDSHDPNAGFVFSIDGESSHHVQTETEAAKIIMDAARRKYVSSFDVAVEGLQEDWTPPEDWMSYKGAWIYPVDGGYEANFTGEHFEAPTIEELKIKLMNAREHRQKFSGYSERDSKFADNIKKFGRELPEGLFDRHYDESQWEPEDIEIHKNTDWKARNYQELPVPEDSFEHEVVAYGLPGGTQRKKVKFIKYIRPNEIFPPYYAPEEDAFDGTVGVMYDGAGKRGKYDIHNRYETQDVYDALSESTDEYVTKSSDPEEYYNPTINSLMKEVKKHTPTVLELANIYRETSQKRSLYFNQSASIRAELCVDSGYIPRGNHEALSTGSVTSDTFVQITYMSPAGSFEVRNAYLSDKGEVLVTWDPPYEYSYLKPERFIESALKTFLNQIEHVRKYFMGKMGVESNSNESWSPDMTDCPACGDVSFDSKKGRCARCSYTESVNDKPLYIIKDSHGNQLSAPNPSDDELWDRVASMEARGRRGLCVVAYTSSDKSSLKEWNEFSDDDFEDDQMHAAVYGGDSKYCSDCGAVKTYDEDGFSFCPECNAQSYIQEATKDSEQDELTEASYGGAYDIADDQYFTREDLVNCAEKVIEHLNETFDDTFQIADVRLEGPNMILEVDGDELGWYMEKCKIDMRRIRVPSDLTNRYALELASQLIAQIKSYNNL